MADYENDEKRTSGAKKAALGVAVALGGLACRLLNALLLTGAYKRQMMLLTG